MPFREGSQASRSPWTLAGRKTQVRKLIAGDPVLICDVRPCLDVLAEQKEVESRAKEPDVAPREAERPSKQHGGLSCSFCGKSQREVKHLIGGLPNYICDECSDLAADVIREEIDGQMGPAAWPLPEPLRPLDRWILEQISGREPLRGQGEGSIPRELELLAHELDHIAGKA